MCGMKLLIATAAIVRVLVVAGSILLCGCGPSATKLAQGYKLERFDENGKYYVTAPEDLSGGGVFDGTVERIGWNQNWILARVTRLYHGDTNGWYALNLKTKQVIGPVQESELSSNVEWSRIKCYAPEVVKNRR